MKSRKTRMFVALGLFAISGFSLMIVSADEAKTIKLDVNNAIQTIPQIIFKQSIGGDNSVTLRNVEGKSLIQIVTNTNSFVLSKGSDSSATGNSSTILGGNANHIENGNPNYSTIIGGDSNQISNASYGTIGGGSNGRVTANYGVVAGGDNNVAGSTHSTVVGGMGNQANGQNSVALGVNNQANGSESVAMGSGATVNASNSFLWNDGTSANTINSGDVFAVIGEKGMIVNTEVGHRFAQLTIGGSLLVNESSFNTGAVCNGSTQGVLKVMNREDVPGQVCFCNCDGTKWNSLFGAGKCSSICDNKTVQPACGSYGIKNCEGSTITYSGTCLTGTLVEGTGAFLIGNNGHLYWTCQTTDGTQVQCNGAIAANSCPNPEGTYVCTGNPENAEFLGGNTGLTDNLGPKLYSTQALAQEAINRGEKCVWHCKAGFYLEGEFCLPRRACTERLMDGYEVAGLADYATGEFSKIGAAVDYGTRTCKRVARCDNGTISWVTGETCTVECNVGFRWTGTKCVQDGACGTSHESNQCTAGTPSTVNHDTSAHKWTWTCAGINGGNTSSLCSENEVVEPVCGSEHYNCSVGELSTFTEDDEWWRWSCKGYNTTNFAYCSQAKPCTVKTCSSTVYTLSSCPEGANCTSCTPVDSLCTNGTTVYSLNSCPCGSYKNGDTCTLCGAKKYSSAGGSCQTASVGYYANSSCSQTKCTNGPEHSRYTSNASTNDCSWECESGYTRSGNTCVANPSCTPTTCSSSYNQTSCPSGKGCSSCTATNSDCTTTTKFKVDCTLNDCSGYGYTECPAGKTCDSCNAVDSSCNTTTKYKVTGTSCTPTTCSSSYNQASCPSGKGCSSCTATNSDCSTTTKFKVDCTLNDCSGYGYTECPAGKTCDSCNAVDSSCNTTTKYKVTGNICTPSKTCSTHGYSSTPGSCYNIHNNLSNGCTNTLTCYENGCNGTKDTCYYPDSTMPSDFASNPNFSITDFDHGVCATNNCFPAGTKVTMADGSLKNIEDIVADDMVLSYNERTHKVESNRVLSPIVHENVDDEMYELVINGKMLKVTGAHRFYVKTFIEEEYQCVSSYDWVAAKDLKIGDMLFVKDGTYSIIESIVHYAIHDTVYNLSVENNHTYFVEEGYLVHNSKIDIPVCTPTTCSSNYSYNTCPSGKGCSSCTATNSDCTTTTKFKVDCTLNSCSSEYSYGSCPAGKTCDSCTAVDSSCNSTTKYKVTGSSCTPTTCSSDYSYNTCPSGKICDSCTKTNSDCTETIKFKVTGDCKTDETKPAGCYKENIGDDGCGGTYKYYTAMSTSCSAAYLWDASQCKCVSCTILYPQSEGWYTSKPSGCWTAGEQVNCHGPVWTHYTNQADSCNGSFNSSTCTCTECPSPYSMYVTSIDNCRYKDNPTGVSCIWGNQCCKCEFAGTTPVPTCSTYGGYLAYDDCNRVRVGSEICNYCYFNGMGCYFINYCPSGRS